MFEQNRLPCQHIVVPFHELVGRKHNANENLIDRWKMEHTLYLKALRLFKEMPDLKFLSMIPISPDEVPSIRQRQ